MTANSVRPTFFIVTCEHGGNRVPARYRALFHNARAELVSHRGFDYGAARLARDLARQLAAPIVEGSVTRLIVDLNRSPHHRQLHSQRIRLLSPADRADIMRRYYWPYRHRVETLIASARAQRQRVVHLSAHTFTPIHDGKRRSVDIGLLFDPGRAVESRLCRRWQEALRAAAPALRVRRNSPYRGTADGLTTAMRRHFGERGYAGIEVEVSQIHSLGDPAAWRRLRRLLATTAAEAIGMPVKGT